MHPRVNCTDILFRSQNILTLTLQFLRLKLFPINLLWRIESNCGRFSKHYTSFPQFLKYKNFVAIINLSCRMLLWRELSLCYATYNKKVKNIIRLLALIYFVILQQFAVILQQIFRFDEVEHSSAFLLYSAQ